jgi:DNA invertase Pin-like site-specific DNA recombinase
MFHMLGVFAEFERSILAERVRAGLARAKVEGKQLGRPPISPISKNSQGSPGKDGAQGGRAQDRSTVRRRSGNGPAD